jgi:hypothetical protein
MTTRTANGGLWLFHVATSPDGAMATDNPCLVVMCLSDGTDHHCRTDEVTCNPNSGSLTALPVGTVLYRGGAGSGVSAARLYSESGLVLWTSLHVGHELSPSGRYLLVGEARSKEIFAPIDTLTVVDLRNGETAAQVDVPKEADVRATWGGDVLLLVWPGGEKRVALDGAGKPGAERAGDWRPFSN